MGELCRSEVITKSLVELIAFFKIASQKKVVKTENVYALMGMVSLKNTAPEECVATIITTDKENPTYKSMVDTFWTRIGKGASEND